MALMRRLLTYFATRQETAPAMTHRSLRCISRSRGFGVWAHLESRLARDSHTCDPGPKIEQAADTTRLILVVEDMPGRSCAR